jgi:probable F420-dependent oxidoreductase
VSCTTVGLVLPTREALRSHDPGLIARSAQAAEIHGVDSLWTGDSLLARPLMDPIATLAHVAGLTTSIRLGTGVLLVPMRSAALTAQAIGSLDQLSGGRVIIGAGRGFDLPETRREFEAAGSDFSSRTARFTETIELWRRLWADGRATIDREWCRLRDEGILPKPVQPGGPPIWLAGQSPRALELVGTLADGWLPYPPEPDQYRSALAAVRDAAAAAGREPDAITPAVMVTVAIGDGASPHDELARYVKAFYGYPIEVVSSIQACRAGEPAEIVGHLHRYWEAGARGFVLRLASLDGTAQQIEQVAEHILPAVRSWSAGPLG